jgi:hypothetical protein
MHHPVDMWRQASGGDKTGDTPGDGDSFAPSAPIADMGIDPLLPPLRPLPPREHEQPDEQGDQTPLSSLFHQPNRLLWGLMPTAAPAESEFPTEFHLVGALANASPGTAEQVSAAGLSIIEAWADTTIGEGGKYGSTAEFGRKGSEGAAPTYHFVHALKSAYGLYLDKDKQQAVSAQLTAACPALSSAEFVDASRSAQRIRRLANHTLGQGTVTPMWQAATEAQHFMIDRDTYHPFPVLREGRCFPNLDTAWRFTTLTSRKQRASRTLTLDALRVASAQTSLPIFTALPNYTEYRKPAVSLAVRRLDASLGPPGAFGLADGKYTYQLCGWTDVQGEDTVRWLQDRGPQWLAASTDGQAPSGCAERAKRIAEQLTRELESRGESVTVRTGDIRDIRKKIRQHVPLPTFGRDQPLSMLWATNDDAIEHLRDNPVVQDDGKSSSVFAQSGHHVKVDKTSAVVDFAGDSSDVAVMNGDTLYVNMKKYRAARRAFEIHVDVDG